MSDETVNFQDLLSMPAESAEAPAALPSGVYCVIPVSFQMRKVDTKNGERDVLTYQMRVTEPAEGVNPDDLVERGIELPRNIRHDFFLTKDSMHVLRKFFENLNMDISRPFNDLIPEAVNMELKAVVTETPSKNPGDDRVFNNIQSFAPME